MEDPLAPAVTKNKNQKPGGAKNFTPQPLIHLPGMVEVKPPMEIGPDELGKNLLSVRAQ